MIRHNSVENANFLNSAGSRIASIYALCGLRYVDVLLYLSILTRVQPENISANYDLVIGRAGSLPLDPTANITPGVYRIVPTQGQSDIKLTSEPSDSCDLFPPYYNDDAPVAREDIHKYTSFDLSVAMRDRRCIVMGISEPNRLVGAPIIPFAWKPQDYMSLPTDIANILIQDCPEGINDLRNGALIEMWVCGAFKYQDWSVVPDGTSWRVVAMTGGCPKDLVGKFLRLPDPGDGDFEQSYRDQFIHPRFLQFHLESAVWRHIHAYGVADVADDEVIYDYKKSRVGLVQIWQNDRIFANSFQRPCTELFRAYLD
ncbi:hypothetical protein DFS34DRAFT_245524 [Phlyctochytrium arcticum]|nr:hypothetical protein DFS34DRAFT_245524 [Phlyctochytrium arcticum]